MASVQGGLFSVLGAVIGKSSTADRKLIEILLEHTEHQNHDVVHYFREMSIRRQTLSHPRDSLCISVKYNSLI